MDVITLVLIALLVLVVAAIAFVALRSRQRSGSVLAAPPANRTEPDS